MNKFKVINFLIAVIFCLQLSSIISFSENSVSLCRRVMDVPQKKYVQLCGIEIPYVGSSSLRVPAEEESQLVWVPELEKDFFSIALGLADKYPDGRNKKPENIMIIGESGLRKSAEVRYLAWYVQAPFFWIPMNQDITEDDLEGHPIINSENHDKPFFIDGPLVEWAKTGGYLLLDDANMARPDVLKAIIGVLDKKSIKVVRDGEIVNIPLHSDCRLFINMNPATYEGRAQLGEAFPSRFHPVLVEPYSRESLETIVRAKLNEDFSQAVGPMLDIYEFVQNELILNDSGNEIFSSLSRKYYFSLRDILAAVDYINKFGGSEASVDTVARALNYAFRSRLETKELRQKFDNKLKNIEMDGRRPNMAEILYYEKFYERGANVSAAMIKGWVGGLDNTIFADSALSGYISDLDILLTHDKALLRKSAAFVTTLFPDEVSSSMLNELVSSAVDPNSDLFDSLRAVNILLELSEENTGYAKYIDDIYKSPGANALLKLYAGAALIKSGFIQDRAMAKDIADILLQYTYPDNVTSDTQINLSVDIVVSKMIEALGWVGVNDERFINRLKELLTSGERPSYRAEAAAALVNIGVEHDLVKTEMLRYAASSDVNDQATAALIAAEALTKDMMKSDVSEFGKPACKKAIIKLSQSTNSSVVLNALHASILLGIDVYQAANELMRRFEDDSTPVNDKLTIVSILASRHLNDRLPKVFISVTPYFYFLEQDKVYEFLKQYLKKGRFNVRFDRTYQAVMAFAGIMKDIIKEDIAPYQNDIAQSLAKLQETTGFDEELEKLLVRFGLSDGSPATLPYQEGEQVPNMDDVELVVVAKLLADLENILPAMALRHPFILGGYSSIGKTALVEFVAALLHRKYDYMNLSVGRDSSYLVGEFRPDSSDGGKISWVFSPLVVGAQEQDGEGSIVLLDEINLSRSAVLERLNTLIDRDGYTEVPEYREGYIVKRDENFILAATMNPLDEPGTKVLSPAFMNRWRTFWVNDYCEEELKHIVKVLYGLNDDLAQRAVNFQLSIKKAAIERALGADRASAYSYNIRHLLRLGSFMNFYDFNGMSKSEAIDTLEKMVRVVYDIMPSDENNPDRQKFEELIADNIRL